ncbi:TrmH family RNA methyltransferase [Streptomyces sp. SID13031]|uniref:TrmH family RNA methyltransferase n=1 Tax=Streptomyces sp. SID13031 TaxID=2706046 RepID=UPI0013CB138B|nr:TrmH family RNA methyltransferase [Streptomyces sp. SID13031]NEA30067.1 RNA methyltransferase [Streptomyces sp. SID13031]
MAPSLLDALAVGAQHPRGRALLAVRKDSVPGRILIEGSWEHSQLLSTLTRIDTFYYCPEACDQPDTAEKIAARAAEVHRISPKLLARVSRKNRSDGLISIARLPSWQPNQLQLTDNALILVADGVEYAGNLGTLIRTVDAASADCLILTSRRAKLTNPAVYAASRGMVLTTPVLEFQAIGQAASWLKQHHFDVHLADPAATGSYKTPEYRGRTAFVVGSEGEGLHRTWHEQGFAKVSIPMLGKADSLNVALSAGILLFEARARKEGW